MWEKATGGETIFFFLILDNLFLVDDFLYYHRVLSIFRFVAEEAQALCRFGLVVLQLMVKTQHPQEAVYTWLSPYGLKFALRNCCAMTSAERPGTFQ